MKSATIQQPAWTAAFAENSPLFEPLRVWAGEFSAYKHAWPGLDAYQRLLDVQPEAILTRSGQRLKIVPQDARPQCYEQRYAPRVFMTGELQTRSQNWHDFFQFLSWLLFPKAKATINALHISSAQAHVRAADDFSRRSPLENMLSLFDECGAVIVASDAELLQLIREFRWQDLFWQQRTALAGKLRCIVFGHAMYEKALQPYIGLTANAILLEAEPELINAPIPALVRALDERLSTLLGAGTAYKQPKDLQPFPILGMPGWHANNGSPAFYDNVRYFRPGRSCKRYEA